MKLQYRDSLLSWLMFTLFDYFLVIYPFNTSQKTQQSSGYEVWQLTVSSNVVGFNPVHVNVTFTAKSQVLTFNL